MKLFNTLGRRLQEFKPIKSDQVTLYTCGPTVYHYAHIGNLRSFIFDDTLRRALAAAGYKVRHVMNITDVGHLASDADAGEDKMQKGAAREGKTVEQVAEMYTEAFKADMAAMSILPPNVDPERAHNRAHHDAYARATDFIPEQIDMVARLLDRGFAYITEQAVYFDVTKLPSYGELTGQKLADKEIGARAAVVTDDDKRSPQDFAVWFFTVGRFADHSMRWPSPWGEGFPGWHLECSAIIHATLGDPIDIHTGGVDHIGTHHPNEMAQTEAAFGHPLANYWIHNDHILVDGAKMSKSKGNAYTLKDITDHKDSSGRNFSPMALRLLFLQAHYRSEVNFTWESLEAAQNRLANFYAWADLIHQPGVSTKPPVETVGPLLINTLGNDLATPALLELIETGIDNHTPSQKILNELDSLLGLGLANRPDITAAQKHLITDREAARAAKDWARSDALRAELAEQGIEIDDTPAGPRWRRASK